MIKVKHFLEKPEPCDGSRFWIESIGVTKDLRRWCKIDHVLPHLGPPKQLWDWFEEHPGKDGYEYFRGQYHEYLSHSPYKPALQQLACVATRETFTLLHQSDDPEHNVATALHEYLVELEAWCPPE